MDLLNITIISERLQLVSLSEKYVEDIFKEFTPEITRYMFPRSPENIDETRNYIQSMIPNMKKGKEVVIVILNRHTSEFLGAGGLHNIPSRTPNFGIWIKKSAHGHHFGREAITALKEWAEEHVSYDYLLYPVDRKNIASRKIAESLGGVIWKEYKKETMSGNVLDEVEYKIERK